MEISEIKAHLSIIEVLGHYNIKRDKNSRICCPFHDDKTPSMQVYEKTGTVYCFSGNCKTHGRSLDVIDFIMNKEGVTKHEALKKATEMVSVATPDVSTPDVSTLLTDFKSLELNLKQTKGAEYLNKRGLGWQLLRDKAGVRLGYNSAKHPQMKHCVLFPLRSGNTKITGMYGRSIYDIEGKKHYYFPDRKGLFPYYPASTTAHLVLSESIIDACSLLQHTNYTVLALYGTNGLTDEHLQVIVQLKGLKEITLFFDGDAPGRKALESVSTQLQTVTKAKISHVATPDNEDINSLIISHNPEILDHLVESRAAWTPGVVTPEKEPQNQSVEPFLFSTEKERTTKSVKTVITNIETDTVAASLEPILARTITPATKDGRLQVFSPELLIYSTGTLKISILGGVKLTGLDRLRATLKITDENHPTRLPVRHNLDLYHAVQSEQLQAKISENLHLEGNKAAIVVEGLISALENYRSERMAALQPKRVKDPQLTEAEKGQALAYLKAPQLLKRTMKSIAESGIVGEESNALITYLVYTSRKRESPLHLMCLGASGTGKTYLQEKVGELMPTEDKLEITTLSENAFYYFGQEELKHKLILIEDLDGAADVLYPLRELQSKRKISKTVTLKDNKGNLKTVTLTVEGPVSVSGCTTREKLYEDNANRCLLLEIDTGKDQDGRIMAYQRKLSAGLVNKSQETQTKTLLQNAQRILKKIPVRNPYAQLINLPDVIFKPRRTIGLLLSFIETVTFYHQYQLPVKTDPQTGESYIETQPDHIRWAFKLLTEVLFRKSDELTGACRKFFEGLKTHLKAQNADIFTAAEIRKIMRLHPSNLKRYLVELERYGYIKGKGSRYRGYQYSIVDMQEYEALTGQINADLQRIIDKVKTINSGS